MTQIISQSILKKVYSKRPEWVHKGQYGKLAIIGGSHRHTGSPVFVGMAAVRAGCDLVYVAAPYRAADIAANWSPNLITEPLDGHRLHKGHVKEILHMIKEVRANAVAIGPGLWREKDTIKAIIRLIDEIDLPMVIDADAVRAIAWKKDLLKVRECVLTPHADEF